MTASIDDQNQGALVLTQEREEKLILLLCKMADENVYRRDLEKRVSALAERIARLEKLISNLETGSGTVPTHSPA